MAGTDGPRRAGTAARRRHAGKSGNVADAVRVHVCVLHAIQFGVSVLHRGNCSVASKSKHISRKMHHTMEEDELFGDLTADDHADDHERVVNPQQAAAAAVSAAAGGDYGDDGNTSRTSSSEVGGGGLAGHETRSNQAAFHKMGYLEAYDATKEERLQEGFEVGYRESVELAQSIGLHMGRLVGRTASTLTRSTGKDDDDGGGDDDQVNGEADAVASKLVARTVRAFLDGQMTQQSDAVPSDEALKQIQDLEKTVKEHCKETQATYN